MKWKIRIFCPAVWNSDPVVCFIVIYVFWGGLNSFSLFLLLFVSSLLSFLTCVLRSSLSFFQSASFNPGVLKVWTGGHLWSPKWNLIRKGVGFF